LRNDTITETGSVSPLLERKHWVRGICLAHGYGLVFLLSNVRLCVDHRQANRRSHSARCGDQVTIWFGAAPPAGRRSTTILSMRRHARENGIGVTSVALASNITPVQTS